jgi:hypothetical protein
VSLSEVRIKSEEIGSIVLNEMIVRTLKNILRSKMRTTPMKHFADMVLGFFNATFDI